MSDHDVLSQAVRALRSEHTGQRAGSGFTRAQVMKRLHQKRRRRLLRWLGLSPVAALVAGSAWAQATDSWPVVWQSMRASVSAAIGLAKNEPSAPMAPPSRANTRGAPKDSPTNAIAVDEPAPPAPLPIDDTRMDVSHSDVPDTESLAITDDVIASDASPAKRSGGAGARQAARNPQHTVKEQGREQRDSSAAIAQPSVTVSETALSPVSKPSVDEPSPDQELLEFRRAHDAHFVSRSSSAAIASYQRYLERYPRGRFVPEARYNLALLRLKQGQTAQAERELAAFARGAYGGYRKSEAKALLEALKQHKKSRP